MGGSKSSSSSKPVFFDNQKEQASRLFEVGGLFEQILGGAPDAALDRSVNREQQRFMRNVESSGLDPQSGAVQRGLTDLGIQAAQASQDNQFNKILSLISPAGTQSHTSGGSGGLFSK